MARAMERLSRALDRLETSVANLPPENAVATVDNDAFDALAARHEALRSALTLAVGRIDNLLDGARQA